MSRFVELICHLNAFHKIFFIGSVLLRGWVPDGLLEVGDILYLRSHLGRGLPRKSRGCGFWPAQASGARCSEAQFGKSAVDPLAFSSPPRASLRAMVVAATFFVPKQSFQVVFTADNCLCLLQVWSIGLSGCHPPVCSVPWQSFSSMPPFNVPPSLEVGGEPHVQAATREDSLVGRRDQWFWQSCGRWMVFSHGGEMLAEWQTMQMFKMPPPTHTHTPSSFVYFGGCHPQMASSGPVPEGLYSKKPWRWHSPTVCSDGSLSLNRAGFKGSTTCGGAGGARAAE